MIVSHGDIALESAKRNQIEWIRNWRNSDAVRLRMLFQEVISPQAQEKWYEKVVRELQFFFICHYQGKPVGVVFADTFDWEQGIVKNSGIFIGDVTLHGSGIPLQMALLFTHCGFAFGLHTHHVVVRNDNYNAIAFNAVLGYKLSQREADFSRYTLYKEDFEAACKLLPEALQRTAPVKINWEEGPIDAFMQQRLALFPGDFFSISGP